LAINRLRGGEKGDVMARPPRAAEGGLIYHALNWANAQMRIFDVDADYAAFAKILAEVVTPPSNVHGKCPPWQVA